MKHEKFVQDAKISPTRYYRNPTDVVRDRRLTNEDRLEILDAWEREARNTRPPIPRAPAKLPPAEGTETQLDELRRLRQQIEAEGESKANGSVPG